MKKFTIKRTATCDLPVAYLEFTYDDINIAHSVCEGYGLCYCRTRCGCQFEVQEVEILSGYSSSVQPLTMDYTYTIPNVYISPTTNTGYTITVPTTTWTAPHADNIFTINYSSDGNT